MFNSTSLPIELYRLTKTSIYPQLNSPTAQIRTNQTRSFQLVCSKLIQPGKLTNSSTSIDLKINAVACQLLRLFAAENEISNCEIFSGQHNKPLIQPLCRGIPGATPVKNPKANNFPRADRANEVNKLFIMWLVVHFLVYFTLFEFSFSEFVIYIT